MHLACGILCILYYTIYIFQHMKPICLKHSCLNKVGWPRRSLGAVRLATAACDAFTHKFRPPAEQPKIYVSGGPAGMVASSSSSSSSSSPRQSSWMTLGSARDVIRLTRRSGWSVNNDRELRAKPPAVIPNGIPEHSKDGTQAQPPPMLARWIVQRWPPFEISIPPKFFWSMIWDRKNQCNAYIEERICLVCLLLPHFWNGITAKLKSNLQQQK